MRSKQKSTVSKPRLLRAFQGPAEKNPRHFRGLLPNVRSAISVRNHSLWTPAVRNSVQLPGVHTAPVPARAGDRGLHQHDRRGVLAAPTPRTRQNHGNPRNCGTFAQHGRTRRGVPEPGCGVVSRNSMAVGCIAPDRATVRGARESGVPRRFALVMEREPLDSLEYESTYLELRPTRERLGASTNAPILARRLAAMQMDGGAVASGGIARVAAMIGIEARGNHQTAITRPDLEPQAVSRPRARALHRPGSGPAISLPTTDRRCPGVSSAHVTSLRRRPSWTPLWLSLSVVSASVGILADVDVRAARGVFVLITGVLLLGWARLARRERPRSEPFGVAVTRSVDRFVTAVGTFFAIALWARYAPLASASFSRTVVLVLCGLGLIRGLLAAAQGLLP